MGVSMEPTINASAQGTVQRPASNGDSPSTDCHGRMVARNLAGDVVSGGYAINIPISNAGAGLGGNAHAANEFYVIEGAGKVYGMAGAEKTLAAVLYNYAGKN